MNLNAKIKTFSRVYFLKVDRAVNEILGFPGNFVNMKCASKLISKGEIDWLVDFLL